MAQVESYRTNYAIGPLVEIAKERGRKIIRINQQLVNIAERVVAATSSCGLTNRPYSERLLAAYTGLPDNTKLDIKDGAELRIYVDTGDLGIRRRYHRP